MRETNTAKEAKTTQQDKGISQILSSEKRTWISVAFIWIGTMICIPMLMVGGLFASSLTMGSIFWATVIGFAICCLLMVLGGIIGSDLGLNATHVLHPSLRHVRRKFLHGAGGVHCRGGLVCRADSHLRLGF